MTAVCWQPVHTQPVVLDIGGEIGALIVHANPALRGREIEISPKANAAKRTHTDVLEREFGGRRVWVAVFPELPEGEYSLWRDVMTDEPVTIAGGGITEVNWRDVTDADDFREARPEGWIAPVPTGWLDVLPPIYQRGKLVSAAPMGSAPMTFAPDGQVAWDQMWGAYCDLALAGGPKHRDTVLEPGSPEAIAADPESHARVLAELERGLRLVSGLPVEPSPVPGWVDVRCDSDEMARWLMRAIAVENVSVRRDGALLSLPAGPSYRLDKEIKNVVTVVAKTCHYWQEHRAATFVFAT